MAQIRLANKLFNDVVGRGGSLHTKRFSQTDIGNLGSENDRTTGRGRRARHASYQPRRTRAITQKLIERVSHMLLLLLFLFLLLLVRMSGGRKGVVSVTMVCLSLALGHGYVVVRWEQNAHFFSQEGVASVRR